MLVLKDTIERRGILQPNKGKSLISRLSSKTKKKCRKIESSADNDTSRVVSTEVTLHPAKKKKCGRTRRRDDTSTSHDLSSLGDLK